jgi:hypothetical protein
MYVVQMKNARVLITAVLALFAGRASSWLPLGKALQQKRVFYPSNKKLFLIVLISAH